MPCYIAGHYLVAELVTSFENFAVGCAQVTTTIDAIDEASRLILLECSGETAREEAIREGSGRQVGRVITSWSHPAEEARHGQIQVCCHGCQRA